eukprot:15436410-Alexandrium_andersonii.AAC.1
MLPGGVTQTGRHVLPSSSICAIVPGGGTGGRLTGKSCSGMAGGGGGCAATIGGRGPGGGGVPATPSAQARAVGEAATRAP